MRRWNSNNLERYEVRSTKLLLGLALFFLCYVPKSPGQTLLFNDTLRPFGAGGYGFSSVCQDDSFYYVVGQLNHYQPNWQHMVVKLDKSGSIQEKSRLIDSGTYYVNFPYNSVALQTNLLVDCTQLDDSLGTRGKIIAYDKHSLDTLWTRVIAHPDTQYAAQPGAHPFSELTTITATPDGGFILTGNYNKHCITGNIRSFLLKLDSAGNIQWRKTYDDIAGLFSLALAPNGGYAFLSKFAGTNFVLTDSLGNVLWKLPKQNYVTTAKPADLLYDGNGGFLCTIYYEFGMMSSTRLYGVNVFRIDINTLQLTYDKTYIPQEYLWCVTLHEDLGIDLLPSGEIVISGSAFEGLENKGFILKLDQNADSLWCKNYFFGTPNDGHCQLNDLLPTDDGGFLGVGFYLPDNDDIAAWMFKTDANGFVGILENDPQETAAVKVFPNPAASHITLDLSTGFRIPWDSESIYFYDQNGRLVHSATLNPGQSNYVLNLEGYAPGMYFFEVIGLGGRLASGKFIRTGHER